MVRTLGRLERIRFGGAPVHFGVGAPDVVGPGIAALQAALAQFGGAGITNPAGAVAGLQAAGNAAVGTVGPAIDAQSGGAPDVMRATQYAWTRNGKLAGINASATATQADVDAAKAIVAEMIDVYGQAQRLARAKDSASSARGSDASGRSALPSTSAPSAASSTDTSAPIPWPIWAGVAAAGVILIGGTLVAVARARTA